MEALYHFIRASTAGLYRVLFCSPLFFIDCWSFVHLFSGILLMGLALRLRVRRRWALLAATLLAYEALEIAFVYASVHLFFPESLPDQFTDIVVGLAGAGVATWVGRHRSPSGCWYFKNFVLSPASVGSFVPSSSSLARRLVSLEREFGCGGTGPRRILEIGGGTGAITRKILGTMRPGDRLHVVEMHRDFAPVIEKLVGERRPGGPASSVRIINCDFESFARDVRDEAYDVVYCSLPFNSMAAREVADILLQINRILTRSGLLIYFEYINALPLRVALSLLTGNPNPGRLRAVTGRLLSSGGVGAAPVFANFPPAMARCVRRIPRQDALARDLLSCLA